MNLLSLALGGMCIISSAIMGLFPHRKREAASARKAELAAGASERYFEERRTIGAYPSPKTDRGWRIKGAALILLGTTVIPMGVYR